MNRQGKCLSLVVVLLLSIIATVTTAFGQGKHVRWDIISLTFTPPITILINPGGVDFAFARNPSTLKIKLTGSGTFVAPASGGPSSAVTGGGDLGDI